MGLSLNVRLTGANLPRALIFEHDREAVRLLKDLLSKLGYDVFCASNCSEASVILYGTPPPKIVIMEMSMASIDLCRRLRAEPRDYYPYFLMTAANDQRAVGELALHSGADDFLPKPYDALGVAAHLSVARRILDLQDGLIIAREELRVRATKDSLTGLFNRASFLDLFQRELDRAMRSRSHTGFLLIDLDHFKKINDSHGHSAGDAVLVEVARRLKRTLRSYDFVGRYGGEEFCAVLSNCLAKDLRDRAEAIRSAIFSEPICFGGATLRVSASVGATSVFANAWSATETIAIADIALYRAKNAGRNCVACCRRRMSKESIFGQDMRRLCGACDRKYSEKCVMRPESTAVPISEQYSFGDRFISGAFDQ